MPRLATESYLIESGPQSSFSYEEDQLFDNTNQRLFASNVDMSRKDYEMESIFDNVWENSENKLGIKQSHIKKEQYCKFITDLISELKDGSQAECQVLLLEPSHMKSYELNSMRNVLCQHLLDELNLGGVYFLKSSVASCFSQGSASGIVIDSG